MRDCVGAGLLALAAVLLLLAYATARYRRRTRVYGSADYPCIAHLERDWEAIRDEIPPFDADRRLEYPHRSRTAWNNDEAAELSRSLQSGWMRGWQNDADWFNFPLVYDGRPIDRAAELCPRTLELLLRHPNVRIAGYSVLMPGSTLDPHRDLTGPPHGSMAFNMLLTPGVASSLTVGGRRHDHAAGKAVVFDATKEHSARNHDPDRVRTILYVDFGTAD